MSRKNKRVIDVVLKLTNDGTLDVLLSHGLLSVKTVAYRDMFLKYDSYVRQGFLKKECRKKVAEHFNGCEDRTVSRAISCMVTKLKNNG